MIAPISLWLIAVSLAAPPAVDYDVASKAWNGLSYLKSTAGEAKVDLDVERRLDLNRLRHTDVVLAIYPSDKFPTRELVRFVRDGGSLVVADDFGGSADIARAVGLTRVSERPSQHRQHFENWTYLPEFKPPQRHFLFFNTRSIVANHPAAFRGKGDAIVSFGGGEEHLVVERSLGRGKLLLIADASIFLNQMLRQFYGNKQFAANVLRLYCDADPCRVRLVTPATTYSGKYQMLGSALGAVSRVFNDAGSAIDRALVDLDREATQAPSNTVLVWALLIGGVLVILLAIGGARQRVLTPSMARAGSLEGPWEQSLRALAQAPQEANFHALTAVLIREVKQARARRESLAELSSTSRQAGQAETWAALQRIDAEAVSFTTTTATNISAERFMQLYRDTQTVLMYALNQGEAVDTRSSRLS